jgi:hypothetical protein
VTEVLRAAETLQAFCRERGWRFCFIGGIALLRWGEPRETIDADLTLLTGFGGEEPFVRELLQRFESRVAEGLQFALANRVVLLRAASGVGLDVALGGLAFEESAVNRATPFTFLPGISLVTCSAEDLIVMKAFAARPKDWLDVEGVIVRQSGHLDWAYVERHLQPLAELKEAPAILQDLERRRREFEE